MFVTLITDCKDDNALGRSTTRLAALFPGSHLTTMGVDSDLEAAGNLIDALDAAGGGKGVILVNVAPRQKEAKKWSNGTPFGFFYCQKTLVISSIDGLTLSLVKKLKIADQINLLDIPEVVNKLAEDGVITKVLADHIIHTQFRSFEFLPRVAKWLLGGLKIPHTPYPPNEICDAPAAIWWVDNFGNCKTTLLPEDINFSEGKKIQTSFGEFVYHNRLKDVPDDQQGIIIGSSGLANKRFLEIVVQGQSASKVLNIKSSDVITFRATSEKLTKYLTSQAQV